MEYCTFEYLLCMIRTLVEISYNVFAYNIKRDDDVCECLRNTMDCKIFPPISFVTLYQVYAYDL